MNDYALRALALSWRSSAMWKRHDAEAASAKSNAFEFSACAREAETLDACASMLEGVYTDSTQRPKPLPAPTAPEFKSGQYCREPIQPTVKQVWFELQGQTKDGHWCVINTPAPSYRTEAVAREQEKFYQAELSREPLAYAWTAFRVVRVDTTCTTLPSPAPAATSPGTVPRTHAPTQSPARP